MKIKILYSMVLIIIYLCTYYLNISFQEEIHIYRPKHNIADTKEMRIYNVYQKEEKEQTSSSALNLYARSAALMDATNGRVLFSKNGNQQMAMASTTKIMTCIILLEHGKLDDIVTFSENASRQPDVQLNASAGEQFIFRDLLYALMLESYNDVAVALAEHVGGSVEGFAKLMNQKAKELQCSQTNFITPNGLDAPNHYSTSVDLCKIASYAIKNDTFLEITNTKNHTFQELSGQKNFSVTNRDAFLSMYEGAIGVKTGFTCDAGYCFVGAVQKKDRTLVSTVLASGWPPNKTYKWSDTKKMMDLGCEMYERVTIFPNKISFPHVYVKNSNKKKLTIYSPLKKIRLLSNGTEAKSILLELPAFINAPVEAGSNIGTLYYVFDHNIIKKQNIYAKESIQKYTLLQKLKHFINIWWL